MTVRLSDQPQPDWNTMPRLLQELCDGHPGYVIAAYAFDGFGHREWLCKHCWLKRWEQYKQARAQTPDVAEPTAETPEQEMTTP